MLFAIAGALVIFGIIFLVGFLHGRVKPPEKPQEVRIR